MRIYTFRVIFLLSAKFAEISLGFFSVVAVKLCSVVAVKLCSVVAKK